MRVRQHRRPKPGALASKELSHRPGLVARMEGADEDKQRRPTPHHEQPLGQVAVPDPPIAGMRDRVEPIEQDQLLQTRARSGQDARAGRQALRSTTAAVRWSSANGRNS